MEYVSMGAYGHSTSYLGCVGMYRHRKVSGGCGSLYGLLRAGTGARESAAGCMCWPCNIAWSEHVIHLGPFHCLGESCGENCGENRGENCDENCGENRPQAG